MIRYICLVLLLFYTLSAHSIPFSGSEIVIAGPSQTAADIGKSVAKRGGNMIDAAVATGLALSVTSPYYAALGGGGFALLKIGDEVEVIDFRETAPSNTHPEFYKKLEKTASTLGGNAVGVPGYAAGLYALHKKYGKLPWKDLFKETLALAKDGMQVSGEWANMTEKASKDFSPGGKKHFTKDGKLYRPGETLVQSGLYQALKIFQNQGATGFYKGAIATDIVDSVKASGGVMELKDLAQYKVRWLQPLSTVYEGHKIYLMPPPSSGGVVIAQNLELIKNLKLKSKGALSITELHLLGEIMARSFRGRSLLGDPDFHKNPIEKLMDTQRLKDIAKTISPGLSQKLEPLSDSTFTESTQTTHFSVMNNQGQAIALTVTLNGNYGSKVVSSKFGIALNNEMDDFTTRPGEPNMFGLIQGKGNLVEPGKRPLSSMSPTLVVKGGKVIMTLGSPGGPRIINAVTQVLYRTLGLGWDIDAAIQAPRVHHQFLPHALYIDKNRFSPSVVEGLKNKGHDVRETWVAKVYGVMRNPKGWLDGAYDSRGEGGVAGY
jgi:gamma-glutamyltranspeptidase/glutathione hydrolase